MIELATKYPVLGCLYNIDEINDMQLDMFEVFIDNWPVYIEGIKTPHLIHREIIGTSFLPKDFQFKFIGYVKDTDEEKTGIFHLQGKTPEEILSLFEEKIDLHPYAVIKNTALKVENQNTEFILGGMYTFKDIKRIEPVEYFSENTIKFIVSDYPIKQKGVFYPHKVVRKISIYHGQEIPNELVWKCVGKQGNQVILRLVNDTDSLMYLFSEHKNDNNTPYLHIKD